MRRFMQNFVIDIGDIADKSYLITGSGQPTPQNVEVNSTAHMANMWRRLHRCAAQIYSDLACHDWSKERDLASGGVV